ncbi:hypothetical protein D3C71_910830 [compost metagenome]
MRLGPDHLFTVNGASGLRAYLHTFRASAVLILIDRNLGAASQHMVRFTPATSADSRPKELLNPWCIALPMQWPALRHTAM